MEAIGATVVIALFFFLVIVMLVASMFSSGATILSRARQSIPSFSFSLGQPAPTPYYGPPPSASYADPYGYVERR
nr:hypothetical protein K-LCC10_0331 [Kaumoebavirus]